MSYKMGILNMNCEPPVKEASQDWMNDKDLEEQMLGVILVQQYTLKKGMELFGDRAKEATTKELQQIHDFGTYVPVMQKDLTREEKIKALYALMFIVEKRDGRVKARKVAVGRNNAHFQDMLSRNGHLRLSQLTGSLLPQQSILWEKTMTKMIGFESRMSKMTTMMGIKGMIPMQMK